MSEFDIIADHSKQNLKKVPNSVLEMCNLKMLYLEGNLLEQLSEHFFYDLPKLTWLDLRNNKLTTIPKSIAEHGHLENLLLSHNLIEKLPNELGLVPKLKVLQLSDNPLIYPSRIIVTDGVQTILEFLRTQYIQEKAQEKKINTDLRSVPENKGDGQCNSPRTSISSESDIGSNKRKLIKSRITNVKSRSSVHQQVSAPLLTVTKLSKPVSAATSTHSPKCDKEVETPFHQERKIDNNEIVHEIKRGVSKISLKSYLNNKNRDSKNQIEEELISETQLKEHWLLKFKNVLEEQQKILQQEKNLKALDDWRFQKKVEPRRMVRPEDLPVPPYDVQEEYMRTMSREDLRKEIGKVLNNNFGENSTPSNKKIESLIREMINQLKSVESMYTGVQSPRSEIQQAGKQIKAIMDIHKQLQGLQKINDGTL